MITLKSPREIEMMNESGELLADVHRHLRDFIKPGVTSMEIEKFVRNFIESHGGIAAQIGFEGYEYATCCSINDEICHGFPRKKPLKNGDLIKVDMCVEYKGAMSDSCWSYAVGEVSPEIKRLMEVTKKAMYLGIEQAQVGNFVGHGIGPTIHEEPAIPHYGVAGKGLRLKEGMVITIEPMINTGVWQMKMDPNGWTAYTRDGGWCAQYEHTLAITKEGPKILTSQGEEGTY